MLIAMCNSVYVKEDMHHTFKSFEFEKTYFMGGDFLTYGIAEKNLENSEMWVLVVVRGTETGWEWASNFNFLTNSAGEHGGFSDAANELYKNMMSYLEKTDSENPAIKNL